MKTRGISALMRMIWIAVGLIFAFQRIGAADENRSPFAVDLKIDLPWTLGTAAAGLVPELMKAKLGGPACGLACDPSAINALDRTVLGNRSLLAAQWSDGLLALNLALPHALGLLDTLISSPQDGFSGYGKDTLVILETLTVNFMLNNLVKLSVGRPRPYVYDPEVPTAVRSAPDAAMSFYSGHTSNSFAMATAYSYLFTLRHKDSPWVVPVWIGTHSLAAVTGLLRVEAGKHFWTDVLVGATVGSCIGLLIPALHVERTSSNDDKAARRSWGVNGQGVSYQFAW